MTKTENRYKHSSSFADKLRAGWSKEALMKHYGIDEEKYERLLARLKTIEDYHEPG